VALFDALRGGQRWRSTCSRRCGQRRGRPACDSPTPSYSATAFIAPRSSCRSAARMQHERARAPSHARKGVRDALYFDVGAPHPRTAVTRSGRELHDPSREAPPYTRCRRSSCECGQGPCVPARCGGGVGATKWPPAVSPHVERCADARQQAQHGA